MLGLTLVLTIIGLVLEPAVQAIAPQQEPTPQEIGFPSRLPYAAPMSSNCLECHTDETSLQDGGAQEEDLDRLLINPDEHSDHMALHSRLGCITCHGGIGGTQNVDAAHQNLVSNPSHPTEANAYCLPCHHDLRVEIPEHNIRTPHDRILWGIHEDEAVCSCSNCHGPVAHGEEPIRTHEFLGGYCIDCHEEQDVPPERLKCSGCHIGPHDVSEAMDCETCHVSTELWSQVELAVHPMELEGQHAELNCFECHLKPDFRHISGFTCNDCHTKPHEFGGEDCLQCHVDGQPWSEIDFGEGGFDHEEIWEGYRFHEDVACQGCHFEGYQALPSDCADCHTTEETS
jgi:hypothetical protein